MPEQYTDPYPTDLFREQFRTFMRQILLKLSNQEQSEGSRERYLPLFTQKKILWGLIFAYVPKPADTFRRLSEMASLNQQSSCVGGDGG